MVLERKDRKVYNIGNFGIQTAVYFATLPFSVLLNCFSVRVVESTVSQEIFS